MIKLIEYVDALGRNPFVVWRRKLDDVTRARVTTALVRLEEGNMSRLKGVGRGVVELRLDFGPGYRVSDRLQSCCLEPEPRCANRLISMRRVNDG